MKKAPVFSVYERRLKIIKHIFYTKYPLKIIHISKSMYRSNNTDKVIQFINTWIYFVDLIRRNLFKENSKAHFRLCL